MCIQVHRGASLPQKNLLFIKGEKVDVRAKVNSAMWHLFVNANVNISFTKKSQLARQIFSIIPFFCMGQAKF